jgi:hypothetical protein
LRLLLILYKATQTNKWPSSTLNHNAPVSKREELAEDGGTIELFYLFSPPPPRSALAAEGIVAFLQLNWGKLRPSLPSPPVSHADPTSRPTLFSSRPLEMQRTPLYYCIPKPFCLRSNNCCRRGLLLLVHARHQASALRHAHQYDGQRHYTVWSFPHYTFCCVNINPYYTLVGYY